MFKREMTIRLILAILAAMGGVGVYMAQGWLVEQGTAASVLLVLLGGACVFLLVTLIPKEKTTEDYSDTSCNQAYTFPSLQKGNNITPAAPLRWAAIFVVTVSFPHNAVRKANIINCDSISCSGWEKVEVVPKTNLVNPEFSYEIFRI
jgi:hypothetical protein